MRGADRYRDLEQPQDLLGHLPWDGDFGHLKGDIAAVAHDLRADMALSANDGFRAESSISHHARARRFIV